MPNGFPLETRPVVFASEIFCKTGQDVTDLDPNGPAGGIEMRPFLVRCGVNVPPATTGVAAPNAVTPPPAATTAPVAPRTPTPQEAAAAEAAQRRHQTEEIARKYGAH
jgi:hypothetical protein